MLNCNSDTFGYKPFDCKKQNNKVSQLVALLKDPEIQAFLRLLTDNNIATSDLRILQRLAKIESMLGLDELTSNEPFTIPTRLSKLEDRVNVSTLNLRTSVGPSMKPVTKTERRAFVLVDKLRKCRKRFLTSAEIVHILRHEANEDCRVDESQNVRQTKKEVLEKAAKLFSDIRLDQKRTGRREVRLVLS